MTSIIVPAFNESKRIGQLLDKIPKTYEIVVVDDGSQDNTSELARAFGNVVKLDKNYGKGYACMKGAEKSESDKIIFMDGDLQFDPREISELENNLDEYDLILGTRDMSNIPFPRRMSNKAARIAINFITGKRFEDVLCGFRAIKRSEFFSLGLEKNRYEFECEMLIKACKKNLKIFSVPVSVNYGISTGMNVKNSAKVCSYLAGECIKTVVKKLFQVK